MTCPKCDGQLDGMLPVEWGDGLQRTRFAPFICSWCASLLIIDTESQELTDPVAPYELAQMPILELMQGNKQLWDAITTARTLIIKVPNRRPVLR